MSKPARAEDIGLVSAEQLAAGPVDVRHPPAVAQGQQHRLRHVEVVVELDGHEDRRHASSDVTHGATIPAEQAWKRFDIDVGLMLAGRGKLPAACRPYGWRGVTVCR